MRLFYTAVILLLTAPIFSQELQFGPIQGNALLRSHVAKANLEKKEIAQQLTRKNLDEQLDSRFIVDCPPEVPLGYIIVESGAAISVEIDTFGYGISGFDGYLELLDGPDFNFGSASIAEATIILDYFANDGLTGINNDTLQIKYTEPGHTAIFEVVITVVRPGKTVYADPIMINPSEVFQYCLDDELDFSSPKNCSTIEFCPNNYDGEAYRSFHFTSYSYADTCIVYYASRFPGTDTICIQICDDLTVCDFFKIPITIIGDTLSITSNAPFFDDFSTTVGPYPSEDFWLDEDVFVNTTFAKDPPSVGLVTFDGLDETGSPYDLINGGVGDMLTSKAIDLSAFDAGDSVYLRFFFAPKGYGLAPELDDSFILEFRNNQRQWVEITTYAGVDTLNLTDVPAFEFVATHISDPAFLHDAFQFRFKARTSPGGYGDWWHLDYVHLSNGSTSVNNFPDLAFATTPNSFLKNYTAMPLKHLKADFEAEVKEGVMEVLEVNIANRRISQTVGFSSSDIIHREITTGVTLDSSFTVADASISQTPPLMHTVLQRVIPAGNRTNIISGISDLQEADYLKIVSEFKYKLNASEDSSFYALNNRVESETILSDYFAHDDGSAEIQFFVQFAQGTEKVAVEYQANVEDTLKAVQIMFPHFTTEDFGSQLFNLQVWVGELAGDQAELVYERELLRPIYPDELMDTLQGFTTYRLEDFIGVPTPVVIPKDSKFYVGWEQVTPSDVGIPVGYDLTNPCDSCNWFDFGGVDGWEPFPASTIQGALMVRPVFGEVVSTINAVNDQPKTNISLLTVYPNPASDQLNLDFNGENFQDFEFMIFNQIGQMVMSGTLAKSLDIGGLSDGIYYLQSRNSKSGEIWVNKFVVSKN